jgi:hypothetical protein
MENEIGFFISADIQHERYCLPCYRGSSFHPVSFDKGSKEIFLFIMVCGNIPSVKSHYP